jgi:actin-related protein
MAPLLKTLRHAPQAALESVLVCGGGSAAPGASQRVLRDLRTLAPPSFTPAPVVLPEYMPAATPRCAVASGNMRNMGRSPPWTPDA